jgi:hypothetical protein
VCAAQGSRCKRPVTSAGPAHTPLTAGYKSVRKKSARSAARISTVPQALLSKRLRQKRLKEVP